jgi:hypothetical protein
MRAYSAGTNPGPTETAVLIGMAMIALAGVALWYRSDIYLACQWLIRYPQRGIGYVAIQIAAPIALAGAGTALILYAFLAH